MKKKLSWKFLLGIGVICWILARIFGGAIGDIVGVLADILLILGIVAFLSNLSKKKNK